MAYVRPPGMGTQECHMNGGRLVSKVPRWTKHNEKQCTKIRADGSRCRHQVEKGKARCKWHGGRTPMITGRYSKFLKQSLADAVEAARAADPRDLREEVALLRGIASRLLELTSKVEKPMLEMACLSEVGKVIDSVRTAADTIAKIEERRSITPEQVSFVVQGMLRVLGNHVTPEILAKVAQEMRELKWPAGVAVHMLEEPDVEETLSGA